MSLFGDQNPSPEREPRKDASTPRPQLLVNEIDPVSLTCSFTNLEEMQVMLRLCGISPPDDAVDYLWHTLKQNKVLDLDTFSESLGALGLCLELCVTSRQELQWFPDTYYETRSITLSTQHREGSELGYIQNLNESHPGLDGVFVELFGNDRGDQNVRCKISWEFNHGIATGPGIRWDLIRSIYLQCTEKEVPRALPVASGQNSDDQIVAVIENSFPGSVLLPRTDGVESLIWILPVVALVGGLCVLGLVFRRWKNASLAHASDEDFAIVEAAFLKKNDVTDDENV